MPENRTYTEKEIAALLQRSAQLQAEDARAEKSSEGLTLDELESVAHESGLDTSYLHRAALEMEMSAGKSTMPKKTETHIYGNRFYSGELTDELWEEIVFELRRKYESSTAEMYGSTAGKGISEQIGRSREWRHTSMSGVQTSVLFRPYKKGTRIELSQRVGIGSTRTESIFYGLFTAFFPALIVLAALKSAVWGSASFVAFAATFIPIVYYLDTKWRAKKQRQLDDTGDSLVELMERGVPVYDSASSVKARDASSSNSDVASAQVASSHAAAVNTASADAAPSPQKDKPQLDLSALEESSEQSDTAKSSATRKQTKE